MRRIKPQNKKENLEKPLKSERGIKELREPRLGGVETEGRSAALGLVQLGLGLVQLGLGLVQVQLAAPLQQRIHHHQHGCSANTAPLKPAVSSHLAQTLELSHQLDPHWVNWETRARSWRWTSAKRDLIVAP